MTVTRFPRAPAAADPAAEASFLVNIQTGSVVGAGRLAAKLLGFDAARANGQPLDAAMPAVSTLRAFALSGETASSLPVTLVLWCRRASVRAQCLLERIEPAPGASAAGVLIRASITNIRDLLAKREKLARPLSAPAFVEVRKAQMVTSAPVRALIHEGSPPPRDISPAGGSLPEPRDDRATLQLIARRIEEGVKLHRGNVTDALPVVTTVMEGLEGDTPPVVPAPEPAATAGKPSPSAPENFEAVAAPPFPQQANDSAALAQPAAALPLDASKMLPPSDGVEQQEVAAAAPALTPAALAQLLAQTAHEIKTPLSAISAASEIIRDERLGPSGNERYRTYAADIHASARHALAIVDRLMKMPLAEEPAREALPPSQPASVDAPVKPEKSATAATPAPAADLNALVSACAQELRPLTDARQLHLTLQLDPGGPQVVADAVGLKQSLLNLVTNAMKFTPANGTISLMTSKLTSQGVLLSVRDSGHGMTKGAIARLLDDAGDGEAIAAAARKNGRTATGLGLGMPQVRAFCRANNAQLAIDSTLGHGTTVSLMFNE